MWRTAVTPRWLGLLALACAMAVVCGMLGRWQLGAAQDSGRAEAFAAAAARPVADITTLLQPHTMISSDASARTVTATGTYEVDKTLLIVDRRLGDRTGYWLVTPLRVQATGALLPILRGFTTTPVSPPPPTGPVTVTGMLAPSEGPPDQVRALPPGQLQKIDAATLVNTWPGELYSAFVFAQQEQAAGPDGAPAATGAPQLPVASGLTRVPPPDVGTGSLNLMNLSYALQWWFFGGFALIMWWRMVRDAHRHSAGSAAPAPPTTNQSRQERTIGV